jgi:hypothetical protein
VCALSLGVCVLTHRSPKFLFLAGSLQVGPLHLV